MSVDISANVQRFDKAHEVLKSCGDTLEVRSKAYGDFKGCVRGYAKILDALGADKLPSDQRFLLTMMVMKLSRWCGKPGETQNADSLIDLINYTACLHTMAYPKEKSKLEYVGKRDVPFKPPVTPDDYPRGETGVPTHNDQVRDPVREKFDREASWLKLEDKLIAD